MPYQKALFIQKITFVDEKLFFLFQFLKSVNNQAQ